MKSLVAVVACRSYEETELLSSLRRGLNLLGGIGRFVSPGEKIILKPNLLTGESPAKAVNTHPAVLTAVARLVREAGADVRWGDSPGWGGAKSNGYRAGILQAADREGIGMADFEKPAQVSFAGALLAKQLTVARSVLEADGLINLAKMKTHGLTRITGAVKNLFGVVPGLRKGEYHVKMPGIEHFSAMLVDIARYVKPKLHILDGILAMEGNGPRGGDPRPMNVLLLSPDPIALDSVFCRLIDLPVEYVPTMRPGLESGLGDFRDDFLEIVGDPLETLRAKDFKVVRRPALSAGGNFPTFLKNRISPRPVILSSRCTACGTCVKMCPVRPKAVDYPEPGKRETPVFRYDRCIRCYCCQEICPEKAIIIQTPLLGRLIHRS